MGREGALRRPGRRAQRQATKRVGWRVKPGIIWSARSARAGTAQRAVPALFRKGPLRNSDLSRRKCLFVIIKDHGFKVANIPPDKSGKFG